MRKTLILFLVDVYKRQVRVQGAFVSDGELNKIVDFIKKQSIPCLLYTSTIAAKTYPNQEADVQAIAVRAMLAVTDKMDADTGYAITLSLIHICRKRR